MLSGCTPFRRATTCRSHSGIARSGAGTPSIASSQSDTSYAVPTSRVPSLTELCDSLEVYASVCRHVRRHDGTRCLLCAAEANVLARAVGRA